MMLTFLGPATAAALFALASVSTTQTSGSSTSGAPAQEDKSKGVFTEEDKSGPALFAAVDTNQDGQVTRPEWEAYFKSIYGPGWTWGSVSGSGGPGK